MLNNFKNTFKHTAIYSLGNMSLKVIGLVLLPLYTEHLTTTEYGALTLLEATSMLLVGFLGFKLSTAMMRWCSQEDNQEKRKQIIFSAYISIAIIGLSVNIFSVPFYDQMSSLLFGSTEYDIYFKILLASVAFEVLNYFPLEIIRLNEKSIIYVIATIFRLTIILVLNILFIVRFSMGVKGILLSQLIGHLGVTLLTLPLMIKSMRLSFNFTEIKAMFSYGFPLVFSTIAMMMLNVGDRYLLKYFLDLEEVGIYSLGFKITSVINMFLIQSFQMGFLPIAYKTFDKPHANRFFSKSLTYYVLILVFFSYFISAYSREIIELFAKDAAYYKAYKIVPFLALAFVLRGTQYLFALGLHFVRKTKYNAFIVMSAVCVNVGLNFILIPRIGMYGAAISTVICWVYMILLFYRISNKLYPIRFELNKVFLLLTVFILFSAGAFYMNEMELLPRFFLKLVLGLSIPFILILFGFYEPIEKERLKQAWVKWKNPAGWRQNIRNIRL